MEIDHRVGRRSAPDSEIPRSDAGDASPRDEGIEDLLFQEDSPADVSPHTPSIDVQGRVEADARDQDRNCAQDGCT